MVCTHTHYITVRPAEMARENGENHEDGADEKMLGADDKAQLARKDEVKFIAGEHTNGDAKIDIGNIEKVGNALIIFSNSVSLKTDNHAE